MEAAASVGGGEIVVLPSAPADHPRRRRRSWTIEQKLAIVREVSESGDPVAVVARRHDMNANHLFRWIQQVQDEALGVRRTAPTQPQPMDFIDLGMVGGKAPEPRVAACMEIELPGGVRVRVTPPVEPEALRQVLAAVKAVL